MLDDNIVPAMGSATKKKELIDFLLENRNRILKYWERQVLDTIPVYRGPPVSELRANIGAGLDSLIIFLRSGSSRPLHQILSRVANIRLSENFSVRDVMKAILSGKAAIFKAISLDIKEPRDIVEYYLLVDAFFTEAVSVFAEIFQKCRQELAYLKNIVAKEFHFDNIIGKSKQMKEIFALIPRIADSLASVLITGKSGTGKELIAKSIHFHSPRRNKNLLAINCSALPETLLESEMFGYVKGAFTGATRDKDGLFREAEGGTVFLDEIGDMSFALQAKLLRVLQEREFKKVGGTKTLKADMRVITATNKDLRREMANGNFREDLYYRINVMPINLPELKERKEDIPLLVKHFIDKYNRESGRKIKGIKQTTLNELMNYDWPGNVRELESTIERAVILCKGTKIQPVDLNPEILNSSPVSYDVEKKVIRNEIMELEKQRIVHALDKTSFHRGKAAKRLGINRKTLYRKMKKLGLA